MTKSEVVKLVGQPTEIDTLGADKYASPGEGTIVVWLYGDVTKYGNQRVLFEGDKVSSEVIADGKKYDELIAALQKGEVNASELEARIEEINRNACK
jgi:hypothetical protein